MNNPFGAQEGALRNLDAKRASARAAEARRSAQAEQPRPAPSPSFYRSGDALPGPSLRPEQTLKELKLDRDALLVRELKKVEEFEQLRAFVIELAREHGNGALEAFARKTHAARMDMRSLQQEAQKFVKTLGK